jgi:hypothetical protein
MFCPRSTHRPATGASAPIRTAADAVALVARAITQPLRDETVAFLLDDAGYGGTIFVVAGTDRPEQLLDVVEHLAAAAQLSATAAALVVVSVRPHGRVEPDDIDRWLDASDIADEHGIRLLEWYVVGADGFRCPRDLLGEPQRWSG